MRLNALISQGVFLGKLARSDLGSGGLPPWGFESPLSHQALTMSAYDNGMQV